MIQLQVTLFDKEKRYKPISTLVKVESIEYFNTHKQEIKTEAIRQICAKRYWTFHNLKRFGYTQCKIRLYNKEQLEKEAKERYEQIKKERNWK